MKQRKRFRKVFEPKNNDLSVPFIVFLISGLTITVYLLMGNLFLQVWLIGLFFISFIYLGIKAREGTYYYEEENLERGAVKRNE